MSEREAEKPGRLGVAERLLSPFADVRAGEAIPVLLLTLNVFLLLLAYYLLKTVREPLILMGGGAEVKSYASAGQAVLLVFLLQGYGALTKRYGRMPLIRATSLFFAANLVVFFALGRLKVPYLGVAFYLWVGCFSLTVIAQVWSFANDVYTPEQGKRLFAIVGLGSSLGAMFGAQLAKHVYRPLGPHSMMLLAAGLLLVVPVLMGRVHLHATSPGQGEGAGDAREAPPGGKGGWPLIAGDRYLGLIAAITLLLNWVNTTGEYILDRTLIEHAERAVRLGQAGGATVEQLIGTFKGDFFFWVNALGVGLQLFVVSRVFKHLGVRVALFFLPCIALGAYSLIVFAPALSLVRIAKIGENGTDYSIQNTARQALFLPTSREAKYNAKAAIDTFVVRAGDVLSAGVVWAGTSLALQTRHFAMFNMALALLWVALVVLIGREHRAQALGQDRAAG